MKKARHLVYFEGVNAPLLNERFPFSVCVVSIKRKFKLVGISPAAMRLCLRLIVVSTLDKLVFKIFNLNN